MTYAGGCQCGRIRYRAEAPRDRASVCFCRMCQKASGAPFMAFVRFPAGVVAWSSPPAVFASSNLVERGFCRDCGTPLTYRNTTGPYVSLTLNSLDDPGAVTPEVAFAHEHRAMWLNGLDDLHRLETGMPDMLNHQWPDGEEDVADLSRSRRETGSSLG